MSKAPPVANLSLESLVAAVADEFLQRQKLGERPDIEEYARRYPEVAGVLRDVLTSLQVIGAGSDNASDHEPLTGCLGDFRILREIGRGGMGIVYEAEQISLGRRVALKVLPFAATLDPKHLQRFKNEAQAAAQLHHTNIVPIHFVGADRGVHFYAMQFIDGQSLAQVIADLRLQIADSIDGTIRNPQSAIRNSTARAVFTEVAGSTPAHFRNVARLGAQTARALEHAHDVGVIHRDIKPANLLLDASGNLWITDFGLAQVHGDARLTVTGDLIGTLRYMSPEQTLGTHADVDQRSDIYAMGATLYELITLEPAFPGQQRRELLEQIARDDPKPPRRINPAIPIDLETIVLKALSKNPAERYRAAGALAADLEHFVEDQPIQARRPTLRQRVARWGRRHVVLVRAAALMTALAVAGLAVATALIWHSRQETREALAKAERMQQLAEAAVNDMYTEVAQQWLEYEPLSDPLQKKFLLKALHYFKEFARQNADSPRLARKTALAYQRAGVIQFKFGKDSEADANLSRAISLLDTMTVDSPDGTTMSQELASCHNARAIVLTHMGKLQPAEQDYRQARAILERLATAAPDSDTLEHELARYRVNLAAFLIGSGQFSESEQELTKALEMDVRLAARQPGVADYRAALATTQSNRGILFWKTGRLDKAEEAWKEVVRLARELNAADPRHRRHRELLVNTHTYLAALHHAAGRLEEAEKTLFDSLPLRNKFVEDFPKRLDYQEDLVNTIYNLGVIQGLRGKLDSAEESYRQVVPRYRTLLSRNPNAVGYRRQLASSYNNLGNLLKDTGRLDEAEPAFVEALALLEKQPEDCRREPLYRDELTLYLNNLGYLYCRTGKPKQAEARLTRAVQLREKLAEDFPGIAEYREKLIGMQVNLALLLKRTGRGADEEKQLRAAEKQAATLATAFPNGAHQKTLADRSEALARLLWEAGRLAEARALFHAVRTAWDKALDLEPRSRAGYHFVARFLVDCPDPEIVNFEEGADFAEKALALASKPAGDLWITLGLVRYRMGEWRAALAALEKSGRLTTEERCLGNFLRAMAYARLGNERLARQSFELAVADMGKLWLKQDDLQRRRLDAESVLRRKAG